MWRLSGELAVNCSTLVDLPRQTHGLWADKRELARTYILSILIRVISNNLEPP